MPNNTMPKIAVKIVSTSAKSTSANAPLDIVGGSPLDVYKNHASNRATLKPIMHGSHLKPLVFQSLANIGIHEIIQL